MRVDELMTAFNVNNDKDLGEIFDRSNKAVSKWRTLGEVPAAIEKRANELLAARNQQPPVSHADAPTARHTQRQIRDNFVIASLPLLTDDQSEMIFDQVRGMVGK